MLITPLTTTTTTPVPTFAFGPGSPYSVVLDGLFIWKVCVCGLPGTAEYSAWNQLSNKAD